MPKLKTWIILLFFLCITWWVCRSCSADTRNFRKVSFSEIKQLERGKITSWSNADSSVILKYLFEDLNFLADYIMYAMIEVRSGADTHYYLRQVSTHTNDVVYSDSLFVFPKHNDGITGWYHIHANGSYSMDYDSTKWQTVLLEREDIAEQNKSVNGLPYGTYKLEDNSLVRLKDGENPFVNRDSEIYGIFYVTPPGTGPVDIFNLDSLSKILLSDNHPEVIKPLRVAD
ncbi:hypothetical protein FAZ19_09500 [Sphingobacterium alkalisoli]|uniref:Uncharacterized protein n=1 Tax=Sphingobacterium alkalisoli TaxID=1874115 RepID=A0A4U0H9D9_9SPHI|nr:hypothetical protein [Sphingobacterium alkalisoli]TJY67112.1 hypothetical protein FAZ19_09500 [Sphingobacterium alkalisoli]